MADLGSIINVNANRLASALAQVAVSSATPVSLSLGCYALWQKRSELHSALRGTSDLLPMRDQAWDIAAEVHGAIDDADTAGSNVRFCGRRVSFATARHLALSAYITSNWTVYDRLCNVCGRLVGHESIGNNPLPTANPKLIEHFMHASKDKNKQHGFSLGLVVPAAYGWPAKVSYVIRNWFVHEGLEADGIALFQGNDVRDSFLLGSDAMRRIEAMCSADGIQHSQCCLSADANHPWYDRDLLTILKIYNGEVDDLLGALLNWSVNAFVSQITIFTERDMGALAAASRRAVLT